MLQILHLHRRLIPQLSRLPLPASSLWHPLAGTRLYLNVCDRQYKRNHIIMSQSNTGPSSTGTTTTATTTEVRPILHLRKHLKKPKVKWTDDTIDNEHMNKKKTKICCIFHPADGSDSCSSSDSESDASDASGDEKGPSSPNAYEKQPTYKK